MALRTAILSEIDPDAQPMPREPFAAYVWPTELCSIGCAHCSFGSRGTGSADKRILAHHPEALVQWLLEAGAKKLVICGGGEPLDEPEFVCRAIAAASAAGMQCEIYTSGVSLDRPQPVPDILESLKAAWKPKADRHRFGVRLSVDAFHEERVGLHPLVEWITRIDEASLDWMCWVRGIRVDGDDSIHRLAELLGANLERSRAGSGWMYLRSGRRILVEWKGFVFEHRGRLRLLENRGLKLMEQDAATIAPIVAEFGDADLGRPLSARLPVTHKRMDFEIHADCVVHILESQASDLRLGLLNHSWDEMRRIYFRDPILHRIIEAGLPAVAQLIVHASRKVSSAKKLIPFSVEKLNDPEILNWVTAASVLLNSSSFVYKETTREMAERFLRSYGWENDDPLIS
jgi:hypothetical protein